MSSTVPFNWNLLTPCIRHSRPLTSGFLSCISRIYQCAACNDQLKLRHILCRTVVGRPLSTIPLVCGGVQTFRGKHFDICIIYPSKGTIVYMTLLLPCGTLNFTLEDNWTAHLRRHYGHIIRTRHTQLHALYCREILSQTSPSQKNPERIITIFPGHLACTLFIMSCHYTSTA